MLSITAIIRGDACLEDFVEVPIDPALVADGHAESTLKNFRRAMVTSMEDRFNELERGTA
jgi:hypothetical protein